MFSHFQHFTNFIGRGNDALRTPLRRIIARPIDAPPLCDIRSNAWNFYISSS
jgi:hypothetical protein